MALLGGVMGAWYFLQSNTPEFGGINTNLVDCASKATGKAGRRARANGY